MQNHGKRWLSEGGGGILVRLEFLGFERVFEVVQEAHELFRLNQTCLTITTDCHELVVKYQRSHHFFVRKEVLREVTGVFKICQTFVRSSHPFLLSFVFRCEHPNAPLKEVFFFRVYDFKDLQNVLSQAM